jgi:hypothetical protein
VGILRTTTAIVFTHKMAFLIRFAAVLLALVLPVQASCRVAFCLSGIMPDNVPVAYLSTIRTYVVESLTRLGPAGRQRCSGDVFLYMFGSDGVGQTTTANFTSRVEKAKAIFAPWLVDAKALDELPPQIPPTAAGPTEVSSALYRSLYPQFACFNLVERQERQLSADSPSDPFLYRWVVHLDLHTVWLAPLPPFTSPGAFTYDRIHVPVDASRNPMVLKFAIAPRHYAKALFNGVVQSFRDHEQADAAPRPAEQRVTADVQSDLATAALLRHLKMAAVPMQEGNFPFVQINSAASAVHSAVQCGDVANFHTFICTVLQADQMLLPECRALVFESYHGLCLSVVAVLFGIASSSPLQLLSPGGLDAQIDRSSAWLKENVGPDQHLFVDVVLAAGPDADSGSSHDSRISFTAAEVVSMIGGLEQLLHRNHGERLQLHSPKDGDSQTTEQQLKVCRGLYSLESALWRQLIPWKSMLLEQHASSATQITPHSGAAAGACNDPKPDGEEMDVAYWELDGARPAYCATRTSEASAECIAIADSPPSENDRGIGAKRFKAHHTFGVRFKVNATLRCDDESRSNLRELLIGETPTPVGVSVQQHVPFYVHNLQDLPRAVAQFCAAHASSTDARGCTISASKEVSRSLQSEILLSTADIGNTSSRMQQLQLCAATRGHDIEAGVAADNLVPFQVLVGASALTGDGFASNIYELLGSNVAEHELARTQRMMIEATTAAALAGSTALAQLMSTWEAPCLYDLPPSTAAQNLRHTTNRTLDVVSVVKIIVFGFAFKTKSDGLFEIHGLHDRIGICPGIASVLLHRIGWLMAERGLFESAIPWLHAAIAVEETHVAPCSAEWLHQFVSAVTMVSFAKAVPRNLLELAGTYAEGLLKQGTQERKALHLNAQLHLASGNIVESKALFRILHSTSHYRETLTGAGTALERTHPMHPHAPKSLRAEYLARHSLSELPLASPQRLHGRRHKSVAHLVKLLRNQTPVLIHNVTTGWVAVQSWSFKHIPQTLGADRTFFDEWDHSNSLSSLVSSVSSPPVCFAHQGLTLCRPVC